MALYTATGSTAALNAITYPHEHILAILRSLHPSRGLIADQGRFYQPKGYPTCYATLDYLADMYPGLTDTERGLARWYHAHITRTYTTPHKWETFLWDDPTATTIEPTAANMGGLVGIAGGGEVQHLIARSAPWSSLTATFVDMSGATLDWNRANTENALDFGAVKISARGAYLVRNATEADSQYSDQNNVPLITGTHLYAPRMELWPDGTEKFTTSWVEGGYAYGRANHYESYYDRGHADLLYGSRSMVYLPPDLVLVYDNFTVPDANANRLTERWFFNGVPTTGSNYATITVGNGKVVQTYLNTVVGFTVGNITVNDPDSSCYCADALPTTPTTSNQILMAFETMDSTGSSAYRVTPFTVFGAKAVYVQNASASWIVVWTASTTGANLSGTIVLDISTLSPSFTPSILVADLTPGVRYARTTSGTNQYTLTVVGSGGTLVDTSGVLWI
jgi:hypothetical protein